jgi:hypothetical protein
MTTIEHKENPFPADLEGRLNAILNVTNLELKTITFLHLDSRAASRTELKARVRRTTGQGIYLPSNFECYCRKSLYPIGCVAEERVLEETDNTISSGYSLTEAGRKYGLPIAAFSLAYAVDNNQSLFSILGSTNSPRSRRS